MAEPGTPVEEIMTSPPRSVEPDATVDAAARTLTTHRIGSLIIGEDPIEGIITETDIVAGVADGLDLSSTPVTELMTGPVVTARPTDSIETAGQRMGRNSVKKLPVTERGRAVGIVTTTDLAHHLPRRGVKMAAHREPEMEKGEFE